MSDEIPPLPAPTHESGRRLAEEARFEPAPETDRAPLGLVPTEDKVEQEVVELLETILRDVRETGAKALVVAYQFDRGTREVTSVRFFGQGTNIIACAARALHEANREIDEIDT